MPAILSAITFSWAKPEAATRSRTGKTKYFILLNYIGYNVKYLLRRYLTKD
jgi:hypothetical protein